MAEDRNWTCNDWILVKHPNQIFALLLVAFISAVRPSSGQLCYGVFVSEAVYVPAVNGNYYLVSGFPCSGQRVWMQGSGTSYINYLHNIPYTSDNSSTIVYKSGWVIGTTLCKTISTILAVNTYDGNELLYPYNIPAGHWQEFDPVTKTFINNSQLAVTCNVLTDGSIVGIVFGSILGLIILILLLACICNKCSHSKTRRRRRTAPTTVGYTTDPTAPAPAPVTVIEPPPYDNLPPPAYTPTTQPDKHIYDDIIHVNPATL